MPPLATLVCEYNRPMALSTDCVATRFNGGGKMMNPCISCVVVSDGALLSRTLTT